MNNRHKIIRRILFATICIDLAALGWAIMHWRLAEILAWANSLVASMIAFTMAGTVITQQETIKELIDLNEENY